MADFGKHGFLEGEDRDRMVGFLRFVRELLGDLIERGRDVHGAALFIEDLRPYLANAWDEAEGAFEDAAERVQKLEDSVMARHGLMGPQLTLKLHTVAWLAERFQRLGGKGLLRKLLGAINTLLNSIVGAIGGSGVAEIKDAVRDAIDDED